MDYLLIAQLQIGQSQSEFEHPPLQDLRYQELHHQFPNLHLLQKAAFVVITTIGTSTPVEVINLVNDLAAGRSRRASISKQSTTGGSTNTEASIGKIFTSCCSKPRDGITSALAPLEFVSRRRRAIRVQEYRYGKFAATSFTDLTDFSNWAASSR
jgi:hypothetical protein